MKPKAFDWIKDLLITPERILTALREKSAVEGSSPA